MYSFSVFSIDPPKIIPTVKYIYMLTTLVFIHLVLEDLSLCRHASHDKTVTEREQIMPYVQQTRSW